MSNKQFEWTNEEVYEYHNWIMTNRILNWSAKETVERWKNERGEKSTPEYEILSFIGTGQANKGDIFSINEDGTYSVPVWRRVGLEGLRLEHFFEGENVTAIHSVRRLSDGEVFTLGDRLDRMLDDCPQIDAFLPNYKGNQLWLSTNQEYGYGCALNHATKLPTPKPLFTTEDGVDIYEETVTLHGINTETWIPGRLHFSRIFQDPEWKWFAIPYNRDIYIRENKPCLSYKDVFDAFEEADLPYMNSKIHKALFEKVTAKL
jgi:hypothetical protein